MLHPAADPASSSSELVSDRTAPPTSGGSSTTAYVSSASSVVFDGAEKATTPAVKLSGGASAVQVVVGKPFASTVQTDAEKARVPVTLTSTLPSA